MPSNYPASVDTFVNTHITGETVAASTDNDHADAINKIESELGVHPSSTFVNVGERLTSLESAVTAASIPAAVVSTYRTVHHVSSAMWNELAAGTYFMRNAELLGGPGSQINASTPPMILWDNDDYTIAGKTLKLRLRVAVHTNATPSAITTYTFGLYPVFFGGGVDVLTATMSTLVSGSTAVVTSPTASTYSPAVGADFTPPVDGLYTIGLVTSHNLANNSYAAVAAYLQARWV